MTELQNEKWLLEQSKKRLAEFERLRATENIINAEIKLIEEREKRIKELEKDGK